MFDKLFGSWAEYKEDIDIKYGVIHAPNSHNPLIILTHEFKDIWHDVKKSKNLYHAFLYIFGPPGWSPDGSTLTVRQMQRAMPAEKKQESAEAINPSLKSLNKRATQNAFFEVRDQENP